MGAAKKRVSKPPSKEWFRGPPPESALNRIADALDRFASEVAKGRLVDQERMERFDREHEEDRAHMKAQRVREQMRKIDEERGREPRQPHMAVPPHHHQFPANFSAGVRFCGACGAEDREAG